MRELDRGIIEVGRSADFVIMDMAQHSPGRNILHSVQLGDLPGIGMTIIDGRPHPAQPQYTAGGTRAGDCQRALGRGQTQLRLAFRRA